MPGPDGQFGRREIDLVTNSNPLGIDPNDPSGKDDIVVLGELHVPIDRPVIIELSSKDVMRESPRSDSITAASRPLAETWAERARARRTAII